MFDNNNTDYLSGITFIPYPESYSVMECGLIAMAEQETEWGRIVQESTIEALTEDMHDVKDKFYKIYDKVVDFFKNAWAKIMKIFNQFITALDKWRDGNKKWIKKNRNRIIKGQAALEELKFSDKDLYEKYVSTKGMKVPAMDTLSNTQSKTNDAAKSIANHWLDEAEGADTGHGRADDYEEMSSEKDKVSGQIREALLNGDSNYKNLTGFDASEYREKFRTKYEYNEKGEKDGPSLVYLLKGGIEGIIKQVEESNKTKQEIKKAYSETKKAINDIISKIYKTKRTVEKLPVKDENGDKRKKIINLSAKYCKVIASTLTIDRACHLEAHKLYTSACMNYCRLCVGLSNRKSNKTPDGKSSEDEQVIKSSADLTLESVMGLW